MQQTNTSPFVLSLFPFSDVRNYCVFKTCKSHKNQKITVNYSCPYNNSNQIITNLITAGKEKGYYNNLAVKALQEATRKSCNVLAFGFWF